MIDDEKTAHSEAAPDDTRETAPAAEVAERLQEPADGPEDAPAEQEPVEPEPDGTDPLAAARREAAGYRRRLRKTEAERDAARAALEGVNRGEAERIAEAGRAFGFEAMARGADLWDAGVQLSELLGEDGVVDAAKVQEATRGVLANRAHWRRTAVDVGQGPRESPSSGRSFADVLREGAR